LPTPAQPVATVIFDDASENGLASSTVNPSMESIRTQVNKALADLRVRDARELSIDDLCFVRAHYGQSAFVWALGIVVRAFRERLEVYREGQTVDKMQALIGAEEDGLLERYLDPFIMTMLCQADAATADEWVGRFRTVDIAKVREKCRRRAANEFEVLLKGLKLD
jgi:hypothetical protein